MGEFNYKITLFCLYVVRLICRLIESCHDYIFLFIDDGGVLRQPRKSQGACKEPSLIEMLVQVSTMHHKIHNTIKGRQEGGGRVPVTSLRDGVHRPTFAMAKMGCRSTLRTITIIIGRNFPHHYHQSTPFIFYFFALGYLLI